MKAVVIYNDVGIGDCLTGAKSALCRMIAQSAYSILILMLRRAEVRRGP